MTKSLKYAFRITHIDNIGHIVRCGIVKADSPLRDEHFVSIGDRSIIDVRRGFRINGWRLNEFIPFYFGPRSPMLYVIQHGYNGVEKVDPERIVYCVIRLEDLVNNNIDCIFTDGHALSNLSSWYTKDRLPQIDSIVHYEDVYSSQWNSDKDIDLKRRKEAELLLKNDLPAVFIKGYVVYNEQARQTLINLGIDENMIAVMPGYYF